MSLTIVEGSTDTYMVVLDSQPLGNVTVTIGGAVADLSLDNTTLTFTRTTWASAQTVTVTAVDDEIDDDGETESMRPLGCLQAWCLSGLQRPACC